MKKITNEEIIQRFREVHGDRYDYSKVIYKGRHTKVCIICPIHGEFWQTPGNHLNGHKCPKCAEKRKNSRTITAEEYKKRYYEKFGDSGYDLSLTEYVNTKKKIKVICHEETDGVEHGFFYTKPYDLMKGRGCPKCYEKRRGKWHFSNTEEFIMKARKIHGNKYDYSKVEYRGVKTKVCIICPMHGEFWQTPNDHLSGKGCSHCKESKMEKEVGKILIEKNVLFETQKTFDWLKMNSGKHQYIDFYLPEYNVAIECQGQQHFIPTTFGGDYDGNEMLEKTKNRDKNKHKLCTEHGIKLYYINFDDNFSDAVNRIYETENNTEPVNSEC